MAEMSQNRIANWSNWSNIGTFLLTVVVLYIMLRPPHGPTDQAVQSASRWSWAVLSVWIMPSMLAAAVFTAGVLNFLAHRQIRQIPSMVEDVSDRRLADMSLFRISTMDAEESKQRLANEIGVKLRTEVEKLKQQRIVDDIEKNKLIIDVQKRQTELDAAKTKIAMLEGQLYSIKGLVDVKWAVKISMIFEHVEYIGGADCPLKLRFHLRNDSTVPLDVKYQDYRPELITLKKVVSEVFQIRMAGAWLPQPDGLGQIAVLPFQQFAGWIAVDEGRFNKGQVEDVRGRIGTLVLLVNGQKIEIKL
jgi:hypothetical protein